MLFIKHDIGKLLFIKIALLSIFCTYLSTSSNAQTKRITGKITDGTTGIPGVSVVAKGTSIGTSSDINGNYSIQVKPDTKILTFTFIGMLSQEIKIDRSIINVIMNADSEDLEEVMVIAYGTAKKTSFTGSAITVKINKIDNIPISSVEKGLTGMVSGLTVNSSSGQPGSSSSVRIRGMGSFSAGNNPLYVIDGIPVSSGNMSTINPSDIETLTVLKDAAAASLYGSRAANGVILITSKQGKAGKTKFKAKSFIGFSDFVTNNFENVNGEDFLTLIRESMINANFTEEEIQSEIDDNNWTKPENGFIDWNNELFGTGITKNFDLSASGGNKKTKFFISGNIFDQTGVAKYSDFSRYTSRINLTHKVNNKFRIGISMLNARTERNIQSGGSSYSNPFYFLNRKAWPTETPFDKNGDYKKVLHGNSHNILREYELNEQSANIYRSLSSAWAEFIIIKGLIAKTTASYDWINSDEKDYAAPNSRSGRKSHGSIKNKNKKRIHSTSSSILTYDKILNDKHHLNILAGFEVESSFNESYTAYGKNIPNENLNVLSVASDPASVSGYNSEKRLLSYLSRLNYDLANKYYLSTSIRRDGSSKLGVNQRWANFWSLSGSYRLSKENFIQDIDFIDNLKIRASYGTSGTLPSSYYGFQQLYSYSASYNSMPAGVDSQFQNNELTWEKNHNFSAAVEFGFFSKLSGTVEFFKRKTSDLLVLVPISKTVGLSSVWQNVGEMENKGFEIELNSQNITNEDLQWTTSFNISHVKNKIVKLYNGEDISGSTSIKTEGQAYYSFYLRPWAGVNIENGKPQWYVVNKKGKYQYETNKHGEKVKQITNDYYATNQTLACSPDPDFFGGITNTISYKAIELSFLFNFAAGGKLWYSSGYKSWRDGKSSTSYAFQKDQINRWQKPGDISSHPQRIWDRRDNSAAYSTRFLLDNDFIRLKNISLAYNLPKKLIDKANLNSIKIYVQGTNLFTWSEQDLCDPEQSYSGKTSFEIPNTKTLTFGLELSF